MAMFEEVCRREITDTVACVYILSVIFAPCLLYIQWNGQTPGKKLLRIRCVRDDGRPMNLYTALADYVLKVLTNMPPYGLMMGVLDLFENEKCLHNYLCGTRVVTC